MGALKNFWIDDHVDMYLKYMIFRAIPCNLLLWVCESWALRQSLLDLLEVFLHRNIRRILGISMVKVREMNITNTYVRRKFYKIPCIRNQFAFRQLSYVGKIFQREGTHLPTRLLTAWCDHPRKRGRPLLTHKMSLARNLRLIITEVDEGGALSSWGSHTLDTGHWNDLLATLKHPANTTPYDPPDMSASDADTSPSSNAESPPPSHPPPPSPSPPLQPPPPRTSRDHRTSGGTEENSRSSPSPPPPMTPPDRSRSDNFSHSLPRNRNRNYDEGRVGINIRDSLGVMELEAGVTAREVQVRYRFLA